MKHRSYVETQFQLNEKFNLYEECNRVFVVIDANIVTNFYAQQLHVYIIFICVFITIFPNAYSTFMESTQTGVLLKTLLSAADQQPSRVQKFSTSSECTYSVLLCIFANYPNA